jgi:predicted  nucleic acid-binding Zn-ribbon protein
VSNTYKKQLMANFKEEILLLKIVADVSKSAKDIAGLADVLEKPVSSIADLEEHTKTLTKALKELPQEGTKGFQELSQAIGAVKFIDTDEAGKELIALFDTLNKQLGDNKAKLKQFNDELGRPGTADANIRLLADAFSDIKSVLDKTPQSVKEVEDRLKVLQTFLKRIPAEGTEAFEQLSFEIANLSTGDGDLDNAGAEITQFRETLTTELIASNEALKQFRASMKAPIELPEGSLNALRQELITLRKEFDNLSATERDGEFGQQLVARINNVDKEVRELEESTGRAQRNVGAYGLAIKQALDEYRTIPEIQADLKSLGAEQQRLTTVGNKIAQSLRAGGIEAEKMANILRAQGKTGKDTQDILQKELLETNKILQQVSNTAAQSNRQLTSLQNDVRSATASAGRFVKGALLAVGADLSFQAIKSAVSDTIKTFEEFEERVGTLAGILGKPIERIRELRQNAEALGAATKFSASQVAELQTEFARIGFNEQQILDATESTLALKPQEKHLQNQQPLQGRPCKDLA